MIVRFFDWDQPKNVIGDSDKIKEGASVVIKHEWGNFLAKVLLADKNIEGEEISGQIERIASAEDKKKDKDNRGKGKEVAREAKRQARALNLPMKVVGAQTSLDGSCVVVAFLADGRVDFRQLVRELSADLGKSVRLQQIGSRDEARRSGDYGVCGRELCCRKFIKSGLKSISTDMARCQMITHRGSERLSGACERLMCCLSYEAEQYGELIKKLPTVGEAVEVDGKKGIIKGLLVLAQKIKVELEDGTIVTVGKDEFKVR
jgi:cell fate regulator YaaT (PSP1 superfamily)